VAVEVVAGPWVGTGDWLEGGLAPGVGEGAGAERDISVLLSGTHVHCTYV
jgi:hypothetical protein